MSGGHRPPLQPETDLYHRLLGAEGSEQGRSNWQNGFDDKHFELRDERPFMTTECSQISFEFHALYQRRLIAKFNGRSITSDAGFCCSGRWKAGQGSSWGTLTIKLYFG